MADDELEKIRLRKMQMLIKEQAKPREMVIISSEEQFNNLIKEFPDTIMVIDLWAAWCGPCKAFGPIFEQLQKEYSRDFIFMKVNIDHSPTIAQRYRVTGVPTTLFLKNGGIINKVVGAMNYDSMKQVLEKLKNA